MRYATLLEVEILHDYFLNRGSSVHEALPDAEREAALRGYAASRFARLAPSRATKRALAGHRMVLKATATGFAVAVALDPASGDRVPAVPPDPELRLAFELRIVDPCFFNYTALGSGFYRFSNDSGNVVAGERFLTAPLPGCDPDRAYRAGELYGRRDGSAIELFRAVRDTGPSAAPVADDWEPVPPYSFDPTASYSTGTVVYSDGRLYRARREGLGVDLDRPEDWEGLGALARQYVTAADRLPLRPAVLDLDLSAELPEQATVRVYKAGSSTPAWEKQFSASAGEGLARARLDLRGLSVGMYRCEVLDADLAVLSGLGFDFYLDTDAVREGWLGVIEIGLGAGDMALFAPDGTLRSPRFRIRFPNRATRRRYLFPSPQAVGAGAQVVPEDAEGRILVTELPLPLTRLGSGIRLQADEAGSAEVSEQVLLPEPEVNRLRRRDSQWYSEIYLANLPL